MIGCTNCVLTKICGHFDNLVHIHTIKVVFFIYLVQKNHQKACILNFLCIFAAYLTGIRYNGKYNNILNQTRDDLFGV